MIRDDIINALKTSELGEEGMIFLEMFRSEHHSIIKEMIKEGKLVILPNSNLRMVQGTYIGLPNVKYPETFGDILELREKKLNIVPYQ